MLEKEQVLHVAKLARLSLSEEEIKLYQEHLYILFEEIEKINNIDLKEEHILISPSYNQNCYKDDTSGEMLEVSDVLKNAVTVDGDYIIVPRVIND